jgi:hypothetical protein
MKKKNNFKNSFSPAPAAPVGPASFSGFGDKFKMSSNQWECDTCMVRNLECDTQCKSCEYPRPGSAEATSAAKLWTAQDFFEGVLTKKMFALKLKTSKQAQKFKKIFKEAQTKEKPKEVAKPETRTSETKSLFDRFKPEEGS